MSEKNIEIGNQKLILVVSLWLKNETVAAFEDYERQAAKLLEKYGGRIERAVRIKKRANKKNGPFEIHIVSFPNEQKFADYKTDSETRKLAETRNEIIARTEILEGFEMSSNHEQKFDYSENNL